MACFWRQVIIGYMGKYVVYLMGEKMVWFVPFAQKTYIFFFL